MSNRRKRGRLSRSGDFDRVYRDGRSHANRYLVLYSFPRPDSAVDQSRLGISVSRKVGGAVERNAVKRALREAFWELDDRARPAITTSSSSPVPTLHVWLSVREPRGSARRSASWSPNRASEGA